MERGHYRPRENKYTVRCVVCGNVFEAKNRNRKICSRSCNERAHNARKAAGLVSRRGYRLGKPPCTDKDMLDRLQADLNRRIDARYLWQQQPAVSLRQSAPEKFEELKIYYERREQQCQHYMSA